MDSTLVPFEQAPVVSGAAWRSDPVNRLRALLGQLRSALNDGAAGRARMLTLDGGRVAWIAGAVGLLAMLWCGATVWLVHRDAAQQDAAAAIAHIDVRLSEIDRELSRLAADPDVDGSVGRCSSKSTLALVRASLASTLTQQFMLANSGGDFACGPEGQIPALDVAHRLGTAMALSVQRDTKNRLIVTRTDSNGRIVVAVLDPRAFDYQGSYAHESQGLSAVRLTLRSVDGRSLAVLGTLAPISAVVPGLSAQASSKHYGVVATADIAEASLIAEVERRAPLFLVAAGVVLFAGVALAWRYTLLRARLSHRIARALQKRQFEPYVQPIVDLATGRCAGAEVLMRWNHPQRGTLAPVEFIEEAERSGLIVGMSDLVMARAVHRLAPIAQLHPELYFSFNVTPAQLRQPRFAQRLSELFRSDTVPREQVLVELTEREAVDPVAGRMLASLRAAGWRIAIDDFGTGQSSLASLERLHVDRIKIDRAFVMTIDEQTVIRPVLDAIIVLANQLDVQMIAEGVETQSQWDYLVSRGVQCAQGYLIARPMSIDAFTQWLVAEQAAVSPTAARQSVRQVAAAPIVDEQALQLWNNMRTSGGLDVRDRIYRLRTYPSCFVGREAVDWFVRDQRISRAEAVRLGQRLMALGLIAHVLDEHDFSDAELFYQLVPRPREDSSVLLAVDDLRVTISGPNGVPVKNNTRGLVSHSRCATGRAIVDWITSTYSVPRSRATQWATQLMRQGALRHVFDDQPFRDDRSLYRPG